MNLTVRRLAEGDLDSAIDYYRTRDPAVASRLLHNVAALLDRIQSYPESSAMLAERPGIRRASVPGFPYAIFFRVADDRIEVLRILHSARSPESWPS